MRCIVTWGWITLAPLDLRERGRREARSYGVKIYETEVTTACCLSDEGAEAARFEIRTNDGSFIVRAVLLASGIMDVLPDIPNLREYYGRSVHHCPYCDGWEHRDQRLAAVGEGEKGVKLALFAAHLVASRDALRPRLRPGCERS